MKALLSLLLSFLLAGAAFAQTSVELPDPAVTLTKGMTVSEAIAVFPKGYKFEPRPGILDNDEIYAANVATDIYEYLLELDFVGGKLVGILFTVPDDLLFGIWFKAHLAPGPGAEYSHDVIPSSENHSALDIERWKSDPVTYSITTFTDPPKPTLFDIFFD